MKKIHYYGNAEASYPSCKVHPSVASDDPNRNTDINKTTCVACVKREAYKWPYNVEAQTRHLELVYN